MDLEARVDRRASIALLLVSVIWCAVVVLTIEVPDDIEGPSSRTFPLLFGLVLGVCAAVLFLRSLLRSAQSSSNQESEDLPSELANSNKSPAAPDKAEIYAVVWISSCIIVYALVMEWLGFVVGTVSTILFLLVGALGIKEKKLLILLPLGLAVGIYLVFGKLLGVHLPVGQVLNLGM
jgi:putative tricarboxylic transport membrane protein